MTLDGKFLVVWLPAAELFGALGVARPASADGPEPWMVAGRVKGETPALGVWVEVEAVYDSSGTDVTPPGFLSARPTFVLQWSRIRSARVFDARPEAIEHVDFRSHA